MYIHTYIHSFSSLPYERPKASFQSELDLELPPSNDGILSFL